MMKRAFVTATAMVAVATSIAIGARRPGAVQATTAQAPRTPSVGQANPTFEVASVKRNKSGNNFVQIGGPPGRFSATNVPLRLLIQFSHQMQPFQIVGGPNWITSDRFDILATAPPGEVIAPTPPGQSGPLQLMVRALLVDRFQLVTHTETRDMQVYALVPARSDGRPGAGLRPASVDCSAMRGRRGGGPPPAPPQPGEPIQCGMMIGPGTMNAGGMPMTQLAQALSGQVGRIVTDRTGLSGTYDFTLTYAPEGRGGPPGLPGPGGGGPDAPPADPNMPSIFTALQEQLGLRLESTRGPVEVLVIDRVEPPTED
jgi:uncharacterized protein (TIGR03435 family)